MSEQLEGKVLAGYHVLDRIGGGGMGTVYRATHTTLERTVALKTIRAELADNVTFRERFLRESRLAAQLEHPSIVPVLDAREADGVLLVAMRYVEGLDLGALVARDGPLDPARAVRIVGQVAGALDAAHAQGIVHRDVKPQNVLLESTAGIERSYLTDFGLARALQESQALTVTGTFLGTVDFAAPEQCAGEVVGAAADIYSLGCLLFFALSGMTPFRDRVPMAVIYAHVNEDPPRVADVAPGPIPDALDEVVRVAMAKRPEERFASCGELAQAAEAAVAGGAPPSAPASRAAPAPASTVAAPAETGTRPAAPAAAPTKAAAAPTLPGRWSRRRRMIAASVAAMLGGVVAAILLLSGGDAGGGGEPGEVLEEIPVGKSPAGVAVSEGDVWVVNSGSGFGSGDVTRIDPDTSERIATVKTGPFSSSIATGEGAVWVGREGAVARINPATDEAELVRIGGFNAWVAVGEGAVWALREGNRASSSLLRIDPSSLRAEPQPAEIRGIPNAIAAGEGSVWVSSDVRGGGELTRIDPQDGQTIGEPVEIRRFSTAIALGEGSVWLANTDSDTVTRIDLQDGVVPGDPIPVGPHPEGIAVGDDAVWVANSAGGEAGATGRGSISRLDTSSGMPLGDPIPLPGQPTGVALSEDSVWVTDRAGNAVMRLRR